MASRKRKAPSRSKTSRSDLPDVYQDLLAEAGAGPSTPPLAEESPRKRRRPGERPATPAAAPKTPKTEQVSEDDDSDDELEFEDVPIPAPNLQTMYLDTDEEDEDDEMIFEDVPIVPMQTSPIIAAPRADLELNLTAHRAVAPKAPERRKPITKAERDLRIHAHKSHLLCLLIHTARRNRWCNDSEVQNRLRPLLSKKVASLLKPRPNLSQFGQTESLKDGLEQIGRTFKAKYQVTERGLRRCLWAEAPEHLEKYEPPDDMDSCIGRDDFQTAARTLEGSRDTGAQLLCALLRSAGVQTRLVASFQPLSFTAGGPTLPKPQTVKMSTSKAKAEEMQRLAKAKQEMAPSPATPSARRRLGHPNATAYRVPTMTAAPSTSRPVKIHKPLRESPYPVYWVEVLDVAHQRDANSARSVGKRSSVSRRRPTDVDHIEASELEATASREPMPRNVADFKDHPIYALERHLRRHEVLKADAQPAGTMSAGSKAPLETIYRRRDVRIARSRDKWYRMGRDVKAMEMPVKFLTKRVNTKPGEYVDDGYGGDVRDAEGTPVFTEEQTEDYRPPPVVRGRVPKNKFGNIDLYVPGMVPKGGVWIADDSEDEPSSARAAFILGIDYAPALTGFLFKGRQGTAVLNGVVVAKEYEEAMRAVKAGLSDVEAQQQQDRRATAALRMWKRFLVVLRIHERVYAGVSAEERAADEAGRGFVADGDQEGHGSDCATEAAHEDEVLDEEALEAPDEVDADEEAASETTEEITMAEEDFGGGGFMTEGDDLGGGFMVD
ncbi:DNA repair protein rhp41 [Verticillium alfalfae VaMs.102]|uniref:DNA repair protein rhp41 n=1 Tax=Verticillium alfalfae (strain VaMs.102 / ATCC MYA-4576 / FGSC 10136) TaxID=526221 RepID=C9SWM1_VERA1|nr:DNA repair protein rhp41 [Verticillium alfalfae VaMs.102]EEY23186.1 DNA repair protein rhp41 [Verticillium alfalfae VaMs.102]